MAIRIASVTVDCADVRVMTEFWSAALGYVESGHPDEGVGVVEDPRDRDVELVFVRVPEGKAGKNRVHLDIGADDREAEVRRLIDLGAEKVETFEGWTVMRDPEGNEFCVLQAAAGDPVESWRT
ncbi:MAG: VOC family protein [Chloroflexi bacterium]|nr:VOC family protein [Chloroflexota bacterium]